MNRKEFLSTVIALGGASLMTSNAAVLDKLEQMAERKPGN